MTSEQRSAYRNERNPWPNNEHLHASFFFRGAYVAAIGTVETLLTDLAISASKEIAYDSIRPSFPTRRNDRIDYLRKVALTAGPLYRYRTLIEAILIRFEKATDLRDLCAHARQSIYSGMIAGAEWEIRFYDWFAESRSVINKRDFRLNDRQFRTRVLRAASFSRAVTRLHFRARAILDGDKV